MEDKQFLQYFEQLKSTQKDVLIKTSDKILKAIQTSQKSDEEKTKKDSNEQFKYALKRLTNGIISTNAQVQLNYSFCLTQLFKQHKTTLNVKDIITQVNEKSSKQMAINKTEVNMFAIGRIYIFKAIAKSQMIESKQDADQILEMVFEVLFNDFQAFDFLQEPILEVVKVLLFNQSHFKQKLKLAINKGKFLLQEHTCISIQYLTILFQACEKTKATFSYDQNLKEKVFNHKNLLKALQNETQFFPRKSASYSYIVQYIKAAGKHTPERLPEIWADFYKFLLKEFSQDHKSYYVVLNIFYQYMKQASFEELKYVLNVDLVHMWLRNLSVMNHQLKKLSQKIDNKLIKLINNNKVDNALPQEKQNLLIQFLKIMKEESTYSFTPKSRVAQTILGALSQESVQEYYKYLKHQLHKTVDPTDRKYYLNEIYIVAELLTGKIPEKLFLEISFLLFEQANQSKLKLVFSKIPADIKEDFEEESFINSNRELILGYFYSLLSSTFKIPSKNFQDKKGLVWRGLSEGNESMLLQIVKDIVGKADHFQQNEELAKTMSDVQPYLEKIVEQQKEITQLLKKEMQESKNGKNQDQKQQKKQLNKQSFTLKMKIGFLNLYVGIVIQALIFNEEGIDQLEEVNILYQEIVKYFERRERGEKPKKKRKLNNKQDSEMTSQEPSFINVLVDLLISLLTRSASYLRDVIYICFANFQDHIDLMSIETLTNVLIRENDDYVDEMEGEGEEGEGDDLSEDEYETEDEEVMEEE